MKKIIAIDIRLLGKKRTGDERVFFNLTKALLALDKENSYVLLTDIVEPQKIAVIQGELACVGQENVRFVSLSGRNRFVWNLFTLPWFLLRHPVDIYHTQYILPLWIPARTAAVTHIHDVSFAAYPNYIGLVDRFFLTLLIPRALRKAALVIAPSQFTKEEIIRFYHISAEKIAVIPNALSGDFLLAASDDARTNSRALQATTTVFVIRRDLTTSQKYSFSHRCFFITESTFARVRARCGR